MTFLDTSRDLEVVRAHITLQRGDPAPLVCAVKNFALLWSPKSACTMAVLWFFAHMGLLRQQAAFNSWPHEYRTRILYSSPEYRAEIAADPARLAFVRVIRNPYNRAVSGYEHALISGYNDSKLSLYLGRTIDPRHGYSFAEYLRWLSATDENDWDFHEKPQRHPVEEAMAPAAVINIDRVDLWAGLAAFERSARIRRPGFWVRRELRSEVNRVNSFHVKKRESETGAPEIRFSSATAPAFWPRYRDYLAPTAIRNLIDQAYARDFMAYGGLL